MRRSLVGSRNEIFTAEKLPLPPGQPGRMLAETPLSRSREPLACGAMSLAPVTASAAEDTDRLPPPCVVHLARAANGLGPFRAFLEALRSDPPGIECQLALALKGFAPPTWSPAWSRA